jgi:hypothetical protein
VQTAQADKDMIPRLLAYAERLKNLEPG